MIGKARVCVIFAVLLCVCLAAVSCTQKVLNRGAQETTAVRESETDGSDKHTDASDSGKLEPGDNDPGDFGEFIPAE